MPRVGDTPARNNAARPAPIPTEDREPLAPNQDRMRAQWLLPPAPGGFKYALSEWELTAAGLSDQPPYDEINYVVAGELHVEVVNGHGVVCHVGDTIVVHAHAAETYWAPRHALMVASTGLTPAGASRTTSTTGSSTIWADVTRKHHP